MEKSQNKEVGNVTLCHMYTLSLAWEEAEDINQGRFLVLSGLPQVTRVVARLRLRAATQLGEESGNGPERRLQGFPETRFKGWTLLVVPDGTVVG